MNTVLHLATATDRAAIVDLLNNLNLPTTDLPPTLDNFIIIKNQDKIIGTCGLEVNGVVALLRSLAVTTHSQGQGVGDALLQASLKLAQEKRVHDVYLITNTAADFFANRGFTRVERSAVPLAIQNTSQFSSVCPASATVMYRTVG